MTRTVCEIMNNVTGSLNDEIDNEDFDETSCLFLSYQYHTVVRSQPFLQIKKINLI